LAQSHEILLWKSCCDGTDMEKVTAYDIPVASITVPGVGKLQAGGLVVIVGPNSSGKTQLLRDIHSRVLGQPRELIVCDSIELRKPNTFDKFVQSLIDRGAMKITGKGDAARLEGAVPHFGIGGSVPAEISMADARGWYDSFPWTSDARVAVTGRFLEYFGPMLSTVLFLENRLTATNPTGNFDYVGQKPSNDIQTLHLNSGAVEKLKEEVLSTFGKAIGLDPTRNNILALKVSDLPEPPPLDWISPDKVSKLRGIESEGDGLRSYCAVTIALLLGTRPVCLVDEPEICLHPPQTYAIGRFIGTYGTSGDVATFVATHSSQVLRGILETADKVRIVRLVRVDGQFIGHLVEDDLIRTSLRRPAARSEVTLEGIFADAVTVVEADTDRVAYQSVLNVSPRASRRDTYFAPVGGVGGMPETARFYRALHVPLAIIADLDLVLDPPSLERIAEVLDDKQHADDFRKRCEGLVRELRAVPPDLPVVQVSKKLIDLSSATLDWSKNDDESLARELRQLANSVDRTRRLKSGGVVAYTDRPHLKGLIERVIEDCKRIGLFLVPVGELEGWSPDLMKDGPSREKKAEWANEFVKRVRQQRDLAKDAIDFVVAVDAFHEAETEKIAGSL
jgi:hypothetical protein